MSEHDKANVYMCGIANCTFECHSIEKLQVHSNTHKTTVYICEEHDCEFDCTSAETLVEHGKTHKSFAHMAKQLSQQKNQDWSGPIRNGKPLKNASHKQNLNNVGDSNLTSPRNTQLGSQKSFIEGSNWDSSISPAPRPNSVKIFATRYRPNTSVDEVKKDLEHNLMQKTGKIYTVNVEKLRTKYDSYSSFLITAMCYDSSVFMDEKLWPNNTLVKWYKPPRRNNFLFGEHKSPQSWRN